MANKESKKSSRGNAVVEILTSLPLLSPWFAILPLAIPGLVGFHAGGAIAELIHDSAFADADLDSFVDNGRIVGMLASYLIPLFALGYYMGQKSSNNQ